ncbi:hypothetical protein ACFL01_02785 [Planctomycetota bacterium]
MQCFDVDVIKIEAGESTAITSLVRGKNDRLYAGLTSYGNALVEVDPKTLDVKDLGPIFEPIDGGLLHHKIHNGLAVADDGTIWIGEGSAISPNNPVQEFNLHKYQGGAIHSYRPDTGKFTRHAIPVPHNSIHAMALSPDNRYVAGYTVPDNHFWSYDIESGEVTDYGQISNWCCHCVEIDENNTAYCGWLTLNLASSASQGHDLGRGVYLTRCDLKAREFEKTNTLVVFGRQYGIAGNVGLDAWCRTRSGRLFGSTAVGGVIFEVLDGGDAVRHVGKPVLFPRVGSMVEDKDGVIWGAAGYPVMNIFSFHPDEPGSMRDYGPVETSHPLCYFHGMAVMDDGMMFVGETDSARSQLFRLTPKK